MAISSGGVPVRVSVLGPVRLWRGTEEITLPPRARLVLALLAAHLDGPPLAPEVLVDHIHGEAPPATAFPSLLNTVSALRRVLGTPEGDGPDGDAVIVRSDLGYALAADHVELDAHRLEIDAEGGLAGAALAALLATWTRPAYDGLGDTAVLADESARLEVVRTTRTLAAAAWLLDHDRAAEARDLAALARRFDPFSAALAGTEAAALGALGRHNDAEALRRDFHRHHVDELGVEPDAAALAGIDRGPATPVRRLPASRRDRLHGRVGELQRIVDALTSTRLVTLVGPAGVGKTRLAETVAHAWEGPAVFVPLTVARADGDVARLVADAVGAGGVPGSDRVDAVARELPTGPALVVLDNCEHVISGVRSVVDRALAARPELRILTTSRRLLDTADEDRVAIGPLPPGDDGVALLLDRAGIAVPTDPAGRDALERIVERLDGLPLGLELAAPALRAIGPVDLEAALAEIVLHPPAASDGSDRHASVAAALAWSLDRLDAHASGVLEAATTFTGPFRADAVGFVADQPGPVTRRILAELVASSLLQRLTDEAGDRYATLETIRAVVRERARATPRWPDLQARHAEYFRRQAERGVPELVVGNGPVTLAEMEATAADSRSALQALIAADDAEAVRMATNLMLFWFFSGRLTEGRELIHAALRVPGERTMARARLLAAGSTLAHFQGDFTDVERLSIEGIEIAEAHDRDVFVLQARGGLAMARGDIDEADDHFRRALEATLGSGGNADMGADLAATCAWYRGDHRAVHERFDLMGTLMRSKGVPGAQARWMRGRGLAAAHLGDVEEGVIDCRRSLELERRWGTDLGLGQALLHCGLVERLRGDAGAALEHLDEAIARARRINDVTTLAAALAGVVVAGVERRPDQAAAAFGEYEEIRRRTRVAVPRDLETAVGAAVTALRERLGPERFVELETDGAHRWDGPTVITRR